MKSFAAALLLLAAACASAPEPGIIPVSQPTPAPTASLYQRLGGYDAIAAVTDDFLGRLIADRQLGKYFIGLSQNSKERVRQHIVDLLCSLAKGPCIYVGRDLIESHTGLNITKKEWDTSVTHLMATLTKFKVPAREQQELLTVISQFEEDIVGR